MTALEYERSVMQRALQLTGGGHPAYNIQPLLDLIKQADALGFDVIPKRPDLAGLGQA